MIFKKLDIDTASYILYLITDNFNRLYCLRDCFDKDTYEYSIINDAISHAEKAVSIIAEVYERVEEKEKTKSGSDAE